MLEKVTEPWRPHAIDTYKGPPVAPVAKWTVHRTRRARVVERFGDLQRHPWVGERQAGFARGLYANNVRMVDEELRRVPYPQRLANPASGAYPLVQGMEVGTGPNPFVEETDVRYVVGRRTAVHGPSAPMRVPVDTDDGNVVTGPDAPRGADVIPAQQGNDRGGGFRKAASQIGKTALAGGATAGGWVAGSLAGAALGPVGAAAVGGAAATAAGGLVNSLLG